LAAGDVKLRNALQRAPVRRDGTGSDLLQIREMLGPRQPSKAGIATGPGTEGHAGTWSNPSPPAELTRGLVTRPSPLATGIGEASAEGDAGVSAIYAAGVPLPTSPQGPTTESLRSRLERLKQEKKIAPAPVDTTKKPEPVPDTIKRAAGPVETRKMVGWPDDSTEMTAEPDGPYKTGEPVADALRRTAGWDDMMKKAPALGDMVGVEESEADFIKRPEEPIVDDWLEGLENPVRAAKPRKQGKKGKKGQGRRQARGAAVMGEGEGEQSDHENDGFQGNQTQAARGGGGSAVAGPTEPPEAKATDLIEELMLELDPPAPAPKPKKKNKKGKNKNKQAIPGAVPQAAVEDEVAPDSDENKVTSYIRQASSGGLLILCNSGRTSVSWTRSSAPSRSRSWRIQ
jgi:hypothetical protein